MTISSRRPAVARTRTHPFETSGSTQSTRCRSLKAERWSQIPAFRKWPVAGVADPIASPGTLYLFERGEFTVLWAGLLPTVLPTACKSESNCQMLWIGGGG